MKSLIVTSKNGQYEAKRLTSTDVQVSCIAGRNIYKSYVIMVLADGTTGGCQCSFGRRAGTTCPHMQLVKEFVKVEQAPVVEVVKPVGTFQGWLQQAELDGDILFA